MDDRDRIDLNDESRAARNPAVAHPRAVGSPLPRGSVRRPARGPGDSEARQLAPPPPGRGLSTPPPPAEPEQSSSVQRAANALRMVIPFVQRILPLIDGNIATAVSNVLTSQPQKAAPPVSLAPLQNSVAELQTQHRELYDLVAEQNMSFKRVEDHLEMVREATDRNTLEQQELMEDLKAVGNKVNIATLIALALLAISVLLNLVLYLHIERVLP